MVELDADAPAIAIRWITALVEPPIAASVLIAFSNASRVRIFESFRSSWTMSTMRRPAMRASTLRRPSTAGYAALPGSPMPSASTMLGHGRGGAHGHAVAVAAVHAALGLEELVPA